MSPSLTVCNLPGCPTLTAGNYCPEHAIMAPDEEHAHLVRWNQRREHYEQARRHARSLTAEAAEAAAGGFPEFADLLTRAAAKAEARAEAARLHMIESNGEAKP